MRRERRERAIGSQADSLESYAITGRCPEKALPEDGMLAKIGEPAIMDALLERRSSGLSASSLQGGFMNAMLPGAIVVATFALAPVLIPDSGISTAQAQQGAAQRNRVVIQVSDSDQTKWNLALNNARNLQADLGANNVDIEVVAYGPGIGMLKLDSPVAGRVDEANAAGVKIVACEISMKGQKLARADMLNGIGYVPAGVVELMSRQQQGWAYIRP
jgi:uncharacterized protein